MKDIENGVPPLRLPSAAMQEVYKKVDRFAAMEVPILITGETGVGKEIIAQEIYKKSPRRNKPFIIVNCSTFPNNGLLNSEIFGHERGAFTGATHQRKGVFESAHTGTLFLDEIGDMFVDAQPKLLRVLEQQEFTRLGGNRIVKTDTRIIAATNKNLEQAVENQEFRVDLYYRLQTFRIHVPPLREHREDILPLVDAFIAEANAQYGKNVVSTSERVGTFLEQAPWPGNIRQLKRTIERAVVLTETDEIGFSDLDASITLMPQVEISESPSDSSADSAIPAEVRHILRQISVTEFVLIFAGVPNVVWRQLPEKNQQSIIQEASTHLSVLLGGQADKIRISGLDRDQILAKVAQHLLKKHGTITHAAEALGVDRRTLKSYANTGDANE